MGIISIAQPNDIANRPSLFLLRLDRYYQIQFYSAIVLVVVVSTSTDTGTNSSRY